MQINGRRTTCETIMVDIDPEEVLTKLYRRSTPNGLDHINVNDGHWYRIDGHDYHKNEKLYSKDRAATEIELSEYEAYRIFIRLIRKLNSK